MGKIIWDNKATLDLDCQTKGCTRTFKIKEGDLRRGKNIVKCSAGHENPIDGRSFDKDLRDFARRW
jgi:hypothetical protein